MFTSTFTLLTLVLSTAVSALPAPRTISISHGTITSPTQKAKVSFNTNVGLQYTPGNWCQNGYSRVSVWLTKTAPTTDSIDSETGVFKDGQSVHYFGNYTIANWGLPALDNALPATLMLPAVDAAEGKLFLSVVETARNCPPGINIPDQFGLASTELDLA